MMEHGIEPDRRVLGIAWDGFGYGADGTPWGGEFLLADYAGFERFARFEPVPLPGGDRAAKEPWRMALSYLAGQTLDPRTERTLLRGVPEGPIKAVRSMIARAVNAPLASSAGRLFDAVSWLSGTAPVVNEFEAEAAMRLEAAAECGRARTLYPADISAQETPRTISFRRMTAALVRDRIRGVPPEDLAASFHRSLAVLAAEVASLARKERGIDTVALCGGVFLNRILLESASRRLEEAGFRVLRPFLYSPNDEAISLGQAAFALMRAKNAGLNRSD
jgi:hydrogenase maturation protein HypF